MLVLLIISMLAAPMLQRGINLQLPATESASEISEARIESLSASPRLATGTRLSMTRNTTSKSNPASKPTTSPTR